MAVRVPGFVREPVVGHDFAADERFEGEGGEHVEAEAAIRVLVRKLEKIGGYGDIQARYVDHDVVAGEVIKYITHGLVAECEESGEGHGEACNHRDERRVMCDPSEAVHGRLLKGAVD